MEVLIKAGCSRGLSWLFEESEDDEGLFVIK